MQVMSRKIFNMNNSSYPTTSSSEDSTDVLIWQICSPILLVVGTIGNVLSIIVLSRKSMRRSGMSRYLISLAVSDLFVLATGLLRQWVGYTFNTDIPVLHPALCNFGAWLLYFSLDMSAWILVSVTVERAISVWKPHKVKLICTKRVFVVNIALLVLFLMTINGHFLLSVFIEDSGTGDCECGCISEEHQQFQSQIFPWIDLFLFCLGPFCCHVAGNTVIIVGLVRSSRTMAQYSLEDAEQRENRQHQISSMTKMLLFLNLVFLLCTLPISIFFIIKDSVWTSDEDPDIRLVAACVNLLMYFNNSTNFITYIVSGRRFRAEVCAILRGKQIHRTSTFTLSVSRSSLARSQTLASSYSSAVL